MTSSRIAYLYSLARCENDTGRFVDLVTGVTRAQFIARLKRDGFAHDSAELWASQSALDAEHALSMGAAHDVANYDNSGGLGESYRVVCVAVHCPSAAATTH